MYTCERCGKLVKERYGSGRFCCKSCANSRTFSEDSRKRKRTTNKGMVAYSCEDKVIYLHEGDEVPNGFVKGNYLNSKYSSLPEFTNRGKPNPVQSRLSRKSKLELCEQLIADHNSSVLTTYEKFLSDLALNKTVDNYPVSISSKYYVTYMPQHPRQNNGMVFVHILLAEKLLGRPLTRDEITHHKDYNKLNNSFDNIYIFDNKASHARFHYGKFYWLSIVEDVLSCSVISNSLLNELVCQTKIVE